MKKILKFLTSADVFMTEDFRFYKIKSVDDCTSDGKINGVLEKKMILVQEILPRYKNDYIEIYVIERMIFQPYYFAVRVCASGQRNLCSDVFGKRLFPYKIQMLGTTDFAVAWLGETRKFYENGVVRFEDVQNGDGENWNVYMLSADGKYYDVSRKLGSDKDVHISSLTYDDGILKISLSAQSGESCEKDLLFIRGENEYRRIEQQECDEYWRKVCEEQVPTSAWRPASSEMFCNLQDFAAVV